MKCFLSKKKKDSGDQSVLLKYGNPRVLWHLWCSIDLENIFKTDKTNTIKLFEIISHHRLLTSLGSIINV